MYSYNLHRMTSDHLEEPLPTTAKVRALPLRLPGGKLAWLAAGAYFLALFAYYLLKTTREPLVLATGGAMLKSVSTGVQAMLLVVLLPLHARVAARVGARRLVRSVGLLSLGLILLFGALAPLHLLGLGAAFYVFTGLFGVGAVAELGAFLADVVDPEDSRSVMPLAMLGATLGGVVGSTCAGALFAHGVPVTVLLALAAAVFAGHLHLIGRIGSLAESGQARPAYVDAPIPARDGFGIVWTSPSLRLFALLVVVLNLVNTNGELVLGERVTETARIAFSHLSATMPGLDERAFLEAEIGSFYGKFFGGVNLATVALQLFFAGSLARLGGTRLLLLLPVVVSLGAYAIAGFGAGLAIFHAAKTVENATDYSFGATGRAMAWVEAPREAKLAAKPVIDTFFVRVGDLLAAGFVAAGSALGLHATGFAWLNVGFALAALVLVFGLTSPGFAPALRPSPVRDGR